MKKGVIGKVSKRDIVLLVSFTILIEDEVEEVEDRVKYKHTKTTTIVNRGEWLSNSTKFFVVCFCSLFWALTVHKTQSLFPPY